MSLSLIIPLYNEEKNIPALLTMLNNPELMDLGLKEVLLINNGSTDNSQKILDELSPNFSWARPIHLQKNLNYGGGIFEGLKHITAEYVGYLPGDLQVSADDVVKVWKSLKNFITRNSHSNCIAKGNRTVRMDGAQTRTASIVYTFIANMLLGLKTKDVNGLPKIFHASLIKELPKEMVPTFVFDAQLLAIARNKGWTLLEVPVTFHARRAGVSSWSKKRLAVYKTTIQQVFYVRKALKLLQ